MELEIRHVAPKELPLGSPTSALVFQALRYIGKPAVDAQVVGLLRAAISPRDKESLLRDARYTADWIAAIVRQLSRPEEK